MDIKTQLKRDEGERLEVYLDSLGIPTAGVGHNLTAHDINWPVGTPITQEQSDAWLKEDVQVVVNKLEQYLPQISETGYGVRYWVLVNMAFNMGVLGLLKFHHMLTDMANEDFEQASVDMLNSKWAEEVGARATRLSQQMITGEWQ